MEIVCTKVESEHVCLGAVYILNYIHCAEGFLYEFYILTLERSVYMPILKMGFVISESMPDAIASSVYCLSLIELIPHMYVLACS